MAFTPHHKTIKSLVDAGLLKEEGDTTTMTEAGHEWTRALIKKYPNISATKRSPKKTAPTSE